MDFRDLILTPKGNISHSKLWANIAYAVATVIMLHTAWKGTVTWDLLLAYMGTVGASAAAHKLFALKYSALPPVKEPKP